VNSMYKTIKKMLIKTREQLIEEIAKNRQIEAQDIKAEIMDLYDWADHERDRQLSHILTDRDREKLMEIDEALERIEDGTYGICEECGKKIAPDRLKIMPFALLCVPCKSLLEKHTGAFKKLEEEAPYRDLASIESEELEE